MDADGKLPSYTMVVATRWRRLIVLFGTGVVMVYPKTSVIVDGVSVPEMSPSDGYHLEHIGFWISV